MEADIDHIIEVDPGEAGVLIELIEMLFDEWYISRHNRQERLAKVASVAADKKRQKAGVVKPGADGGSQSAEDAPVQ